jgi:hypothetical protein
MKTTDIRLMAVAGLILLSQPGPLHAASVPVDFGAGFNDPAAPPFPFTDTPHPS